jgi:tetratricopeptide (TPR) repeat protein
VTRTRNPARIAAIALLCCAFAAASRADTTPDVAARVEAAQALAKAARYAEAIDAYREVLARAPGSGVGEDLARTLVLAGRYDEAVTEYRALVQRSPDDFWLRRNLARALSAADRRAEAIPVLDALIAQYPHDTETLRERALIARREGDFATARRLFRAALAAEHPGPPAEGAPAAEPPPPPAEPAPAAKPTSTPQSPTPRSAPPDVTLPLLLGLLVLGIGAGQVRVLGVRTYLLLVCGSAALVAAVFAWLHLAA